MPTVPTEQNRVGIADVTDAKLQPGDYSGTGLQALGAGLRTLGAAGSESAETMVKTRKAEAERHLNEPPAPGADGKSSTAGHAADLQSHEAQHLLMAQPSPADIRDDAVCKIAWNKFSDVCRGVWSGLEDQKGFAATAAVGPAIEALDAGYKGVRDMLPPELHPVYDRSAGERRSLEIAGMRAFGTAQSAVEQDRQSQLVQQNAADDAVRQMNDPDLFERYVATGSASIATQAALRGDDPATARGEITAYRSGIDRRVLEAMVAKDPIAAATRYGATRDSMTAADRAAVERGMFEPLAHALGTRDVDGLMPPPEMEGPAPLSPEQRASISEAIEAQPWTEVRKRYAREDMAMRGLLEDRQRKQTAEAAKDKGLAIAEQLGPDFTSIAQLPPEIRRDLDDDTVQTLGLMAQDNLDGKPVAPNGVTSLMMNLIASQNPAAFAKEDLRLVRGKVTPEEYDAFVRQQQAIGRYPPGNEAVIQQRIGGMVNRWTPSARSSETNGTGNASFMPIAMMKGGDSASQDRTATLQPSEQTSRDPEQVFRELERVSTRSSAKQPAPTKRGPAPAPTAAPAPFLNYLSEGRDTNAFKALKKMGSPPGYVVIYSHGVPESGHIVDAGHGEPYVVLEASDILLDLERKGYKKGTPIVLSSCFAANDDQARELSRLTKGVVYAAKAYVTVPNDAKQRYQLTVHTEGYEAGATSGYARFDNGRETPSTLLGLSYDRKTRAWAWQLSKRPAPIGDRIAAPKASWLSTFLSRL